MAALDHHRTAEELVASLEVIRQAPTDTGTLELIVRRPRVDEREVLDEASLDLVEGLVGDDWIRRGSSRSENGGPNPLAQVTVMSARAVEAVAGDRERWPLAGDQLYVDLDLSVENLPAGTQLAIGEVVLEVTAEPHTGCSKFSARFGSEAIKFVNKPPGRDLRLRGLNAVVVTPGTVRVGDSVTKL
jgi:MOSC domain-containing protein YiiM